MGSLTAEIKINAQGKTLDHAATAGFSTIGDLFTAFTGSAMQEKAPKM